MITLNITPEGEITISQETAGERSTMTSFYNNVEVTNNGEPSQETLNDEAKSNYFKNGWDSAIQEVIVNRNHGRLQEFLEEIGAVKPESTEKGEGEEGVKEDPEEQPIGFAINLTTLESTPVFASQIFADWHGEERVGVGAVTATKIVPEDPDPDVTDPPLIRPAVDSGEPQKEAEVDTELNDGVWTIGDAELQSLKDAEFERGVAYTSPTAPRRYSDDEIAAIKDEARREGLGRGLDATPTIKFSTLRGVADKLAGTFAEGAIKPTVDDLIQSIAESLGYEVVR